jgi:hypothetical protein
MLYILTNTVVVARVLGLTTPESIFLANFWGRARGIESLAEESIPKSILFKES